MPGSTTTHSSPVAEATTKQFVAHGPAGKPAINTPADYPRSCGASHRFARAGGP